MDELVSKLELPEPQMSENAIAVLEKRYFKKDKDGKVAENPKELFWRVALNIASADGLFYGATAQEVDGLARRFYESMSRCEFMPNSPTLMNAGKPIQQLSACFVLPIADSMEGIFDAIKYTALIHQSGGGTGFSFSRLRPHGDLVKSTMGVASGPISFMKVFDAATDVIKQGGTRRGANMGILRVDHPDVLDFIECKRDMTSITNFNISVAATDAFMKAVFDGADYDILNPRSKQAVGKKRAKDVFDRIVENAWFNGDPGIVFIDRMNTERTNPTPSIGLVESTNPCGEQPLLPYESCNLGSVNLAKMLKHDGIVDVDWDKLEYTVKLAARFLDNVIDMNKYPLPEIEQMTRSGNRKIGLGVMGFADMLIELVIPYNSEYAVELAEKVMNFVSDAADEASVELGIKRGPFPNWNRSVLYPNGTKYRNATRTTIAPTGTISIIAGASSGIEPLFAVSYVRVTPTYRLVETNPIFERMARERGFYSAELMEKIAASNTIQHFTEIPEDVRRVFVTAHDITPEWHIRIQAAFQKHTDNAVSKTVNFPNSATVEDVRKVYLLAYELGCKGVTIYRDGSRAVQVLSTKKEEKKEEKKIEPELVLARPRPRPKAMTGSTREVKTGCGDMYVTINNDENGPFELFCSMGKSGGCIAAYSEAIGRLVSLALRSGVDPKQVVKQLKGIRCSRPVFDTGGITYSCADAISKTVQAHMSPDTTVQAGIASFVPEKPGITGRVADVSNGNGEVAAAAQHVASSEALIKAGLSPECPECGESVDFVEGCVVCHSCGYSACG
jgi:ribonucleoside-diphosphate reductase alpha chain